jgi:hypothetical protein
MAKGGSRKVGGGGAAEFGVAAYGAAGSQMARGDGTNMIAINANACTKGGARGGAFLDTIAVPAAFIAANTMYKGRKVYNRSHKFGKRMKKMTRRQRRR